MFLKVSNGGVHIRKRISAVFLGFLGFSVAATVRTFSSKQLSI